MLVVSTSSKFGPSPQALSILQPPPPASFVTPLLMTTVLPLGGIAAAADGGNYFMKLNKSCYEFNGLGINFIKILAAVQYAPGRRHYYPATSRFVSTVLSHGHYDKRSRYRACWMLTSMSSMIFSNSRCFLGSRKLSRFLEV